MFLAPVQRPGITILKLILFAEVSEFPETGYQVQGTNTLEGCRSKFCFATSPEYKGTDMDYEFWRGGGSVDILCRTLTCGCEKCGDSLYAECLRTDTVGTMGRFDRAHTHTHTHTRACARLGTTSPL